jgi:murein DD-endopeptidase MepM/ murein hydrolase activator NlpD
VNVGKPALRVGIRGIFALYLRNENGVGVSGGTAMLSLAQALPLHEGPERWRDRWHNWSARIDFAPDLGADIGALSWWRGLLTCSGLIGTALLMRPDMVPFTAAVPAPLTSQALDAERAQAITPAAWGAETGTRMGATRAVTRLTGTPERPQIDVLATVESGAGFSRVLARAGMSDDDARAARDAVAKAIDLDDIKTGTPVAITLGRHASPDDPRPLEHLAFRARLDLKVELARARGELKLTRIPIAVDYTPLRVQGSVGNSFYRAARAAGVPMESIEGAIHVLQAKIGFDNIDSDARFDLVLEQARAATGEVEHGKLLYIGLERGDQQTRMIEWTIGGHTDWYDLAGVAEKRAGAALPVANAHQTSGFGMRFHPILGYSRMHQGTDYGAPYGSPIHAIADGIVTFAGWHGGHGNFVKLNHAYGMGSGYGHMARIAVANGARVARGQIIGYVGSTGLSTGPHLHFETYRNGAVVNPMTVKFAATSLLEGKQLAAFRAKVAQFAGLR